MPTETMPFAGTPAQAQAQAALTVLVAERDALDTLILQALDAGAADAVTLAERVGLPYNRHGRAQLYSRLAALERVGKVAVDRDPGVSRNVFRRAP